jgi:L-lactate dehydrogenase complex protein LldG
VNAREDVLARVRSALRQRSGHPSADSVFKGGDPADRRPKHPPGGDPVDLFAERVADYRAVVVRCGLDEVRDRVAEGLGAAANVVVPDGFPGEWLPHGVDRVTDDPPLAATDLDAVAAVVTTAALGIAVTGTIVLDHGPGQGRRALSLIPDRHVCVVTSDQVVHDIPDAVRRLDPLKPLTWISGPSATSDIELDRVEGVHGPRNLYVIVVDLAPRDVSSRPDSDV